MFFAFIVLFSCTFKLILDDLNVETPESAEFCVSLVSVLDLVWFAALESL